jgi:dynein heavy chain
MRSQASNYKTPVSILKLWLHEVKRVFEDRFINQADTDLFRTFVREAVIKSFGEINEKENPFEEPLLFTSFMNDAYLPVKDMVELRRVLKDRLDEYNELKAQMNLVLFDQAIEHVCKICRIIALPSGHALLVGVGGSGKQSLARLATFICGFDLEQMVVTQQFGMTDLRNFLTEMYRKIAKPSATPRVYMITDSQIKDEAFLIPINDMLNSGWISDLFTKEDFEALVSNIRAEAKGQGVVDTPENLLSFFYDKMKKNLKVILCFSPVG